MLKRKTRSNALARWRESKVTTINKAFDITFSSRSIARAIRIRSQTELPDSLYELGLEPSRPVIVLVGGADGLMDWELDRLRPLFTESLAPLAEETGAAVIDGGTDSGIMALMGQARATLQNHFPLIGVAVEKLVTWSNPPHLSSKMPPSDRAALESHHTHFILLPGSNWGEESVWIGQLASVLAGTLPSVTVLINGGEIAYQDVAQSVQHRRQVIVLAGSGRTADSLADAMRGVATEPRATKLVTTGLCTVVHLEKSSTALTSAIKNILINGE